MTTINSIMLALGRGDCAAGRRLAAIAAITAVPAWLALATLLAMGPGQ